MLICLNFWYPFGPFFHVTLVGGDDGIVLTRLFFCLLVRFSGSSCLMFIGAVSSSLDFWYPFCPFIHVTLAGEDDKILLTRWFFGILVSFSGDSWLMYIKICTFCTFILLFFQLFEFFELLIGDFSVPFDDFLSLFATFCLLLLFFWSFLVLL